MGMVPLPRGEALLGSAIRTCALLWTDRATSQPCELNRCGVRGDFPLEYATA